MRRGGLRERGVVLVLVLVVTAMVNFLVLDLNGNMLIVQRATHQADRRTVAYYNAISAFNLSRLMLVLQGMLNGQTQGGRASNDLTPYSGMLLNIFSDDATRSSLMEGVIGIPSDMISGFATLDGNYAVTVVDEDGRINLNLAAQGDESQQFLDRVLSWLLAPAQYDDLFSLTRLDGDVVTRDQIVSGLIDWADTNEQLYQRAGASRGAEDDPYGSYDDPYVRKDMPFDSLEEIRLVKGVGDDFWSTFVDPNPSDPERRTLTVWGQGKINVNSAPPRVLAAVVCALAMDQRACDPRNFENVVLLIDGLREMLGGRFGSPARFARAVSAGTENVPGIPIDAGLADKWLTSVGRVYSLYIEGIAPMGGRPLAASASAEALAALEAMENAGTGEESGEEGAAGGPEADLPPPPEPALRDGERDEPEAPAAPPAPPAGAGGARENRNVVVRLHVVLDTTSPWDTQGGRILYWREL